MQKVFGTGPVDNETYLKTKVESCDGQINRSFPDNSVLK